MYCGGKDSSSKRMCSSCKVYIHNVYLLSAYVLCMYMFMYACICMAVCVVCVVWCVCMLCARARAHLLARVCFRVRVRVHICMYARMYVCMYARMYVCMYARMYVCMYARMDARMDVFTLTPYVYCAYMYASTFIRREDAESLVNEAIKDTIFTKEHDSIENRTDGLENDIQLHPGEDKVYHHYEDIDDLADVFKNDTHTIVPLIIPPDQPVKLRSSSGFSVDRTPENIKQKLYRRLSFTAKDKLKYSSGIRKSREAEDDTFVDIHLPPPMGEDTKRNITQKSNISINVPVQTQTKNTFAGFFSALQRKGSKRDLTAKGFYLLTYI